MRRRSVRRLRQQGGVVGIGPPSVVGAMARVETGHAGARIGHSGLEDLDRRAVSRLGQRGQQASPGAHPALLVAGREQHVGRVGNGDGRREGLPVRVVHHAGKALRVLVKAQRGGVAGKGHRAGRTWYGDASPVLVLPDNRAGFPERNDGNPLAEADALPSDERRPPAAEPRGQPLAASPIPPATTRPITNATTAAPAEMQRAVERPSRSPRVDRRPKRTGTGLLIVARSDDTDWLPSCVTD